VVKIEFRKLQKTGGSTFTLTLPKQWIKDMNVKPQDKIAIFRKGYDEIVLKCKYSEEMPSKKPSITISIDYSDPSFNLSREITAAYLAGYNTITIKSNKNITPTERIEIKKSKNKLIGVEIGRELSNEITLKCLIDPGAAPLDETLEEMINLSKSMVDDTIEALIGKKEELANNVISRDEEVNRKYFMIVRQLRVAVQDSVLARRLNITAVRALDYRLVVKSIELVADYAVVMAKNVIKLLKVSIPKNIRNLIEKIGTFTSQILEDAMKALFENRMDLSLKVITMRQEINELIDNTNILVSKEPVGAMIPLDAILDNLRRIAEVGGVDIADLISINLEENS